MTDSNTTNDGLRRSEWYRILGEEFIDLAFQYADEAFNEKFAAAGSDRPPCTVTAEYSVRLRRPTPSGAPVTLRAHVTEAETDRAWVEGTLESGGKVTATCRGLFVAVQEGHPAFHRW